MKAGELLAKLYELSPEQLELPVYIRYDDDGLLHGQLAKHFTTVSIQDQGAAAYSRLVLNGTSKD